MLGFVVSQCVLDEVAIEKVTLLSQNSAGSKSTFMYEEKEGDEYREGSIQIQSRIEI